MVRLVGHKRAQRVHKDAGTVLSECRARCVDVEDERLAAPRGHHAEGGAACLKAREGLLLRGKERILADEGMRQTFREGLVALGRGSGCLRRGRLIRCTGRHGARSGGSLLGALHAREELVHKAGIRGLLVTTVAVEYVLDHELGLCASLPGLVDGLEDKVHHAVRSAGARAVRHAEHDGGNARDAVCGKEAQVGAIGTNTRSVLHGDAAHGEERLLVALAEGLQRLERCN